RLLGVRPRRLEFWRRVSPWQLLPDEQLQAYLALTLSTSKQSNWLAVFFKAKARNKLRPRPSKWRSIWSAPVFSGAFGPDRHREPTTGELCYLPWNGLKSKAAEGQPHSTTLARGSQSVLIKAKLLECACLFWRFCSDITRRIKHSEPTIENFVIFFGLC